MSYQLTGESWTQQRKLKFEQELVASPISAGSNKPFYVKLRDYAGRVTSQFIRHCKSPELAAILENYFIYCLATRNIGHFDALLLGLIAPEIAQMKQGGPKITPQSRDALSLLFAKTMNATRHYNFLMLMVQATKGLLEDSYAVEMYSKLRVTGHDTTAINTILAMHGATSSIFPLLSDIYDKHHLELDLPILPEEKKFWKQFQPDTYEPDVELVKRFGLIGIASHILGEEIPSDKSNTPQLIDKLTTIVVSKELKVHVQAWALCAIIEPTFYEFWSTEPSVQTSVTRLLLTALTQKESSSDVRSIAQRLLVAVQNRLNLELVRNTLEEIVDRVDVAALPLHEVSLGEQGDIFCWALLALIQLKLGDYQKNTALAHQLFMRVELSEQIRNDIIQYHGPYLLRTTHPRWLIECSVKGVTFVGGILPFWACSETKFDSVPQVQKSQEVQKKILADIDDKINHLGFHRCASALVSPVNGFGTFYDLLIARSSDDKHIELALSEVGPYAKLFSSDMSSDPWISAAGQKLLPNKLTGSEILDELRSVLARNGISEFDDEGEESPLDLRACGFAANLGTDTSQYQGELTVGVLLFVFL